MKALPISVLITLSLISPSLALDDYTILNDINSRDFPLTIYHPKCGTIKPTDKNQVLIKWIDSRGTNFITLLDNLMRNFPTDEDEFYIQTRGYNNNHCTHGFPVDIQLKY
jgi:hypothetical protein